MLNRFSCLEVALPPLRERIVDIPLLAQHFLLRFGPRYGRKVRGIEPEALSKLVRYRWSIC